MSENPRFGANEPGTALDAATALLAYAISIAERGPEEVDREEYSVTHQRLFRSPTARKVSDRILIRCTSPEMLWSHLRSIATGSGSWQLRRDGAHKLLDPVIDALHDETDSPLDVLMSDAAVQMDSESVRDAWKHSLERRANHPGGAITMARTLLESTLKTILDDRGVPYEDRDDLPALYKAVGDELGLAPGDYSEQAFRQILGGANSVVVGLGSLRNKVGDAHGSGRGAYRPSPRHAALAVNLAGSMALFLIETHEAKD